MFFKRKKYCPKCGILMEKAVIKSDKQGFLKGKKAYKCPKCLSFIITD